ncbi:hypothetical protein HP453_17290 [Glutamicibacter halophytocola]|nr:hypothetical protein [Glutamicibacter halophytocola]
MFVLDSGPSATDWIGAVSAALTFVVAGIALAFAWGQIKEAEKTRQQVADIERDKAQPMVVAFMEMNDTKFFMELVIKNFGQTPAYDVRFTSDLPLQQASGGNMPERREVLVPEVIPFLAPGQEWRTIWDAPFIRSKDRTITDRHQATIRFKGLDDTHLTSSAILDWSIWKAVSYTDTYGIHHVAKELKELRSIVDRWTEQPNKSGIRVTVRNGDAKDLRIRKLREEEAQDREENPPPKRATIRSEIGIEDEGPATIVGTD